MNHSTFKIISIPETPNREPKSLIVAVSVCIATVVDYVAVPSIVSTVLRRTPPVTIAANEVTISKVVAETARKNSK